MKLLKQTCIAGLDIDQIRLVSQETLLGVSADAVALVGNMPTDSLLEAKGR